MKGKGGHATKLDWGTKAPRGVGRPGGKAKTSGSVAATPRSRLRKKKKKGATVNSTSETTLSLVRQRGTHTERAGVNLSKWRDTSASPN